MPKAERLSGVYSGNEEKQPAGKSSALHVHPNDTHALVIQGRMTHAFEGQPAQGGETRTLGPGSYYMVPAGATLASRCDGPAACRYLHFQPESSRTAAAGEP